MIFFFFTRLLQRKCFIHYFFVGGVGKWGRGEGRKNEEGVRREEGKMRKGEGGRVRMG